MHQFLFHTCWTSADSALSIWSEGQWTPHAQLLNKNQQSADATFIHSFIKKKKKQLTRYNVLVCTLAPTQVNLGVMTTFVNSVQTWGKVQDKHKLHRAVKQKTWREMLISSLAHKPNILVTYFDHAYTVYCNWPCVRRCARPRWIVVFVCL